MNKDWEGQEIEPCPFCGGRARLWPSHSFEDVDKVTVSHDTHCFVIRMLNSYNVTKDLSTDHTGRIYHRLSYDLHRVWQERAKLSKGTGNNAS